MLHRACMVAGCLLHALPGQSRCPGHQRSYEGTKRGKRMAAPGDGAAARLRRKVNAAEMVRCNCCGTWAHPSGVEVDHKIPLSFGGTDTDDNVQVLLVSCHIAKTSEENKERSRRTTTQRYAHTPRGFRR